MENFNEFLHANSSQTSLSCLLDSLQNWKKSTLTFKDAVNTVELMALYIENLAKQNKDKDEMIKNLREKLNIKLRMPGIMLNEHPKINV